MTELHWIYLRFYSHWCYPSLFVPNPFFFTSVELYLHVIWSEAIWTVVNNDCFWDGIARDNKVRPTDPLLADRQKSNWHLMLKAEYFSSSKFSTSSMPISLNDTILFIWRGRTGLSLFDLDSERFSSNLIRVTGHWVRKCLNKSANCLHFKAPIIFSKTLH